MMVQEQVIEGTWEEVQRYAEALKGRYLKIIIHEGPLTVAPEEHDPTIRLLQSWLAEDATDDPAEIQQAENDLAEFKQNMNAARLEAGERLPYPETK